MASRYFRSCRSGLYPELKVTILNDLVSRSKRPFEDFQEQESALRPDVRRQRCGSPFSSQKTSLVPAVPSSPSIEIAGPQVYSPVPRGDCYDSDLDATLLEFSDGESPDSPFSGTLEDEDRLLAEDEEADTSDILLGSSEKEAGGGFAGAFCRVTVLQNVPRAPDVSPDPLLPAGLSVHPGSVLPYSSPPERGISASTDSQSQTGLCLSQERLGLRASTSVEAGSLGLKKGDSGSRVVGKAASQAAVEEPSVVSLLVAEHEFPSVADDKPSEGQAFVDQGVEGGESVSDLSCKGVSNSAHEAAPEHSVTGQNENHADSPSPDAPKEPRPDAPEDPRPEEPSPDDSRRRQISIPEDLLQMSKEKYVASVVAHARHDNIIGAVNELQELMREVASECRSQEPNCRHPTNLTMRNYAQRTNREIQKCSLEEWVDQNQRHYRRFANIPDKFERSPIPSR